MDKKIKQRLGDGKINTSFEMIEDQEEKLWETNPMEALRYEKIETRKKLNWWARFSLSMIIVFTFLFLIWLLFFGALPAESRDLINIMVGAYVPSSPRQPIIGSRTKMILNKKKEKP